MLSILIMDSDLDFAKTLGITFEEKGYSATAVDSTERCLELLRARSFDLVLLELNPSNSDGLKTLEEIIKIDTYCAVVMLARHGEIESAVKALKAGAIDIYVKPVTPYKLLMKFEILEKELQIASRLKRKSETGRTSSDDMKSLEVIEREHIIATLDALKGNKSRAAKVLGISRTTLISKVKQYDEA